MLDLADLLNLDLPGGLFRVRLDDEKVRMRACFDLLAGPACTTTIETVRFGRLIAVERMREANGCQSFANRVFAMEQIGVSQSLMIDCCLQESDGLLMADTVTKGHANSGGVAGDAVVLSSLPLSQ